MGKAGAKGPGEAGLLLWDLPPVPATCTVGQPSPVLLPFVYSFSGPGSLQKKLFGEQSSQLPK